MRYVFLPLFFHIPFYTVVYVGLHPAFFQLTLKFMCILLYCCVPPIFRYSQ